MQPHLFFPHIATILAHYCNKTSQKCIRVLIPTCVELLHHSQSLITIPRPTNTQEIPVSSIGTNPVQHTAHSIVQCRNISVWYQTKLLINKPIYQWTINNLLKFNVCAFLRLKRPSATVSHLFCGSYVY